MIVDTLLQQSRETNRINDFNVGWNRYHVIETELLDGGCWMDDLYENNYGPEDGTLNDEDWMNDLDEAA